MVEFSIKTQAQEKMLEGLQRVKTDKVVLLHSAGADSTAAGILLKDQGKEVYPLFVDYGQTAKEAEEHLVLEGSQKLNFKEPKIIRTDLLSQLSSGALLGETVIGDDQAWVPGRNSLFLMFGGIYAQQINADGVAIGFMLEDTGVFGDSDYFHHRTMEVLLQQSLLRPMEVSLPVMSFSKKSIMDLLKTRMSVELTVSCWNATLSEGRVLSCHECANCLERDRNLLDSALQLLNSESGFDQNSLPGHHS